MSIPGFLDKIYKIVNDVSNKDSVDWGDNGDTINIKKIEDFSKNVLPKYFKHSNFQSFVRQLNMYDFRKVLQDPSSGEFSHPHFRKGHPDLLCKIKRKANMRDSNKKSSNKVTFGSKPSNKKDNHNDHLYSETVANESDDVLNELVQQRMIRDTLEKRINELEKKSDRVDELEQQSKIAAGENLLLKRMINEAKQSQFVLQDKMERIMKAMYAAYVANQQGNELPHPNILSSRALPNLSNMGSSFHDVCGFLRLESPLTRTTNPDGSAYQPQLTGTARGLISSNSESVQTSSTGELYNFDNVAGVVAPPLGFSKADDAVVPLVELPPTPAIETTDNYNSNSKKNKSSSSSSKKSPNDLKKRKLTQEEAEVSLSLDTNSKDVSYEQFLKKARLNADSVTSRATAKTPAGESILDPAAGLNMLKTSQNDTLQRIDSLESTLENFLDAEFMNEEDVVIYV